LVDDGRCVAPGVQDNGCAAGTYALEDGACQHAGLTQQHCAPGFAFDEENRSCEVSLPAGRCPVGSMALPGDERCMPVSPCPTERWAELDGLVVHHVDGSYQGGDSDGSDAKPWRTIEPAIDAAADGGVVAVQPGSYPEDVAIAKPVRLWGRCAAEVEILGSVTVMPGASGTEIHGLAVTDGKFGVHVSGVTGVGLAALWVHHIAGRGIHVSDTLGPASVTLERILVERTEEIGLRIEGSEGALEDVMVRTTAPRESDQLIGRGIDALENRDTGARAKVTLKRAVAEDNHTAGIFVGASDATIEGVVVRGTLPQGSNDRLGRGIDIEDDPETGAHGTTTLRGSLIEHNHDVGVFVLGSDATIEGIVVRSTQPRVADLSSGHGIGVEAIVEIDAHPTVTVRASLVEGSHEAGVFVMSSEVTLEGVVVRGTRARPLDSWYGRGIGVQDDSDSGEPATITVRGSVVEDNEELGVLIAGSKATIDGVVVASTRPEPATSSWGYGIHIQYDPFTDAREASSIRASLIEKNRGMGIVTVGSTMTLDSTIVRSTTPGATTGDFGDGICILRFGHETVVDVSHCLVEDNARAGLSVFGGSGTVQATQFVCNGFDLDVEKFSGSEPSLRDDGENACGCDEAPTVCRAVSSQLDPPEPLASDL
jgi:hypothetical protein